MVEPAATPEAAAAPAPDTLGLARRIAALVRERRGSDVVLLDVRSLVDYTDFFLIATGTSARQNQAIAEHVVKTMKAERRLPLSRSGLETGSWICLDLGDVVVHVFEPEIRAKYDLELLWADAPRVDPEPPPPPAKRRRVARKVAVADADAANAPESERPPDVTPPEGEPAPRGEPAAEPAPKKKPARRPTRSSGSKPAAKRSPAKKRPPRRKA